MIYVKLFVSAILLGIWGSLAYIGKTEMGPFITFVSTTLVSIATHSILIAGKDNKDE